MINKQVFVGFILFFLIMPFVCLAEVDIQKKVEDNVIIINDLNLKIQIPDGWQSMAVNDYHLLAALTYAHPGAPSDTNVITLQISPLNVWPSIEEMQKMNAQRKAAKLGLKQLITIGAPEKVPVSNKEGTAYLYFYPLDKNSFLYELVVLEKDGLAFMFSYWGPRNENSKIKQFREWLKNGIESVDADKHINQQLIKQLEQNDAQLFARK